MPAPPWDARRRPRKRGPDQLSYDLAQLKWEIERQILRRMDQWDRFVMTWMATKPEFKSFYDEIRRNP